MKVKNMFGEYAEKCYEVELLTYSNLVPREEAIKEHDMITFHYITASNYREAVRDAKRMSLKIGEIYSGDYGISEIVDVRIMCYLNYEECSHDPLWVEYYENGKKDFRTDY